MHVELARSFTFDAAHHLPTFPDGHKCRGQHGHGFRVEIRVAGEVDEAKGYLIDFAELKAAYEPIRKQLDHAYLNEIDGLENPTAENLSRWIWQRLQPSLPLLSAIIVHETEHSWCIYRGQ